MQCNQSKWLIQVGKDIFAHKITVFCYACDDQTRYIKYHDITTRVWQIDNSKLTEKTKIVVMTRYLLRVTGL